MEPISGLEYVMLTKITILQGRVRKVFFSWAGQGQKSAGRGTYCVYQLIEII